MSTENQMIWSAPPQLEGTRLIVAKRWVSDIAFYHEDTFDLCQFDEVIGPRGPINRYRRWSAPAKPLDVLVFEPGHAHQAKGGVEASFKVVEIPALRVQRATRELCRRPKELHFDRWISPSLFPYVDAVHRAVARGVGHELEAAFETLLVELVTTQSAEPAALDSVDDRVARLAREFIDTQLAEDPSRRLVLEDVVRAASARGKTQLIRDFEKSFGVAPYEYFKLRRFAMARRLLTQRPVRDVQHIAWDLGYNAHSFARSFRDLHGVTPREYRQAVARD